MPTGPGYDEDNMCMHGYLQGLGCKECERDWWNIAANIFTVLFLLAVAYSGWKVIAWWILR